MSVLYIALPIALLLGSAGLMACLYCIRDGQYDDMDTPSIRMLIDDRDEIDDAGDSASADIAN
ncbi:cbb3-type cytochrome oxidase assembly protein CcoS [Stieleria varia]|uniref:Cytochrome oxidase maturation protein cbb3-type n=1 Tax=Stieleria varia TaxID=2528005 RepID=A0A5C6ASE1_9BACT|nr:cbb3-type cytochrome oxidase assembly protein CcoS [Stieleria varia]TWU02448.1 Cytochrome oxidase maturation protein cbb3-type [Stieleria varia]